MKEVRVSDICAKVIEDLRKNNYDEALEALILYFKENPSVIDNNVYHGERIWVQPSEALSTIGRKYVYLNNCNGLIAKYNMQTGEIII